MIKEAIATAASVAEATAKAKAELNAPIEADVKYEVLQQAQKKVFGLFGGKDAKVRAYYEAKDEEKAPAKSEPKTAPKMKAPVQKAAPAKTEKKVEKAVLSEEDDAAIKKYLETIIKGMGVEDVVISAHEEDDETVYELETSENYGAIIGRHGETLDSVQYLVRLFANKNTQGHKKVSVNVGDYREKRAESLKEFALRSANQVLKYGRSAKLDPMNPYERRIIHTAIQGIEGVTSHSVGYDSERRVIITLEDGVQPTHGDRRRGGYNRGGNRGGYNKGGRGGYNKGGNRGGYKPEVAADREPKSDAAGSSRYGKIEVKKASEE